ncbi:hypothetical protein A8709_07950 [Paenibacillus pectinilyticus]|uniref:Uncharacterized protein n=1 Tax=Paenibacillus pectinilyticus TaxID=512399 RepID=A0A1C1A7M4_9BACL|nr:hypothetical protein [Paenibacillus pectinilyticus]OCT16601.1 hypothetical protein A8709_07950 [Paenibacillus pectinilyticus]
MKVQNLTLIQSRIANFIWSHLIYISSFKYYMDKNKHYEDISMLDIEFLSNTNGINLKIQIRFKEIESLSINASGRIIQLDIFEIVDIKNEGWCSLNFWIRDIESEVLSFYCNAIEVISVDQID